MMRDWELCLFQEKTETRCSAEVASNTNNSVIL